MNAWAVAGRAGLLTLALAAALRQAAAGASECAGPTLDDAGFAAAWRVLRAVDCARCHGKDYEGLAAPSIVAYARTQPHPSFRRMVLDGDAPRGMPAYRDNPYVRPIIDDIYRYFLARANGDIGPQARPPAATRCAGGNRGEPR
jgi:cytochrome c55X